MSKISRALSCLCFLAIVVASTAFSASLPEAMLTIKAVDDDGQPLTNMPVHVWLSDSAVLDGKTGSNGVFIAQGICTIKEVPIRIVKDACYDTMTYYMFPNYLSVTNHKWQPWNPTVTALVRRIDNPIPMYAKHVETQAPVVDGLAGYDLTASDWVEPYGRGVVSDFVFKVTGDWRSPMEHKASLMLVFQNKNDGLVSAPVSIAFGMPMGSKLRLNSKAPIDGYRDKCSWRKSRESNNMQDDHRDDMNYFYRVRSQTNESGIVTNALYGKIHGDIKFGGPNGKQGGYLYFTYYLNPTPNDRNLEFDPKQNLFKNLSSLEEVRNP